MSAKTTSSHTQRRSHLSNDDEKCNACSEHKPSCACRSLLDTYISTDDATKECELGLSNARFIPPAGVDLDAALRARGSVTNIVFAHEHDVAPHRLMPMILAFYGLCSTRQISTLKPLSLGGTTSPVPESSIHGVVQVLLLISMFAYVSVANHAVPQRAIKLL